MSAKLTTFSQKTLVLLGNWTWVTDTLVFVWRLFLSHQLRFAYDRRLTVKCQAEPRTINGVLFLCNITFLSFNSNCAAMFLSDYAIVESAVCPVHTSPNIVCICHLVPNRLLSTALFLHKLETDRSANSKYLKLLNNTVLRDVETNFFETAAVSWVSSLADN